MRALSEEQRWGIVAAWKERGSIRAAAQAVRLDPAVVLRWVSRFKATGDVAPLHKAGRKRALDTAASKKAKELLLSSECSGAKDVARALHSQGITSKQLSPSTVIRAVRRQALEDGEAIKCMRGKPAKQLTAVTKRKRLAFAKANKRRCWDNVMFTDRKKFMFSYPGARVKPVQWGRKGERREAATLNRPMAVNIYAGITMHGVTACHMVAGTSKYSSPFLTKQGKPARNITAGEYTAVLQQTLLPGGQKLMLGRGVGGWVLQQDNDPTHRVAAIVVQGYNKAYGTHISVLPYWPPHSPDLNPIENVWSYVEARVNARGCNTFDEFKAAVIEELQSLPKAFLSRLYMSMHKRLAKVISRGGDKCGY